MTIYEQIQRSLTFVEANLFQKRGQEAAAREAGMSSRSFQHYFWMVTGYSYKEYVIKRRMCRGLEALRSTQRSILEVALEVGYQNHESFTRAFKNEFRVSPKAGRHPGAELKGLSQIVLYQEKYMGVIVKELPEMRVMGFTGFAPEPENQAKEKMRVWLAQHPGSPRPRRIFGHNIDAEGNLAWNPENQGYKFLVTLQGPEEAAGPGVEILSGGKFLVTGIEGSFAQDPEGNFIKEGWQRMNRMIQQKNLKVKDRGRWFEEELESQTPGNLRLDLYVEVEGD